VPVPVFCPGFPGFRFSVPVFPNPTILIDPGVTLPAVGGSMHFGEHAFGWNPISDVLHCVSDKAGKCSIL